MKIIFSKHARYQMSERNISEKEIVLTLLNPDKTISQLGGKFQAVKLINKNYLIVVIYRQTNSIKKVITAFLTSKIKKYLK
ncbi:MAG: DUF4258 domain-containing protein [Patescibacteria group bacterium]|nr:DUF4258 domain-containing protein [Patescibacteria group bacterium]